MSGMDHVGNPYRPGMGTAPLYLADREGQLRRFRQHLADFPGLPHNVRVTGLRGVGKTVLLGEFADQARAAGWITVSHECEDHERDGTVATRRLHALIQEAAAQVSLRRRVGESLKVAIEQLRALAGGMQITYRDLGITVGAGVGGEGPLEAEPRVTAAFEVLGRLAARAGTGAVLMLDEFQAWRDRRARQEFPVSTLVRGLAHVQRRREGAHPVMLVVSGLDPLIAHLAEAESYTERMFSSEVLQGLPPEAAHRAFVEPALVGGGLVEGGLAAEMVRLSAGYPFFIQFFGAYLWRAAGERHILSMDLWRAHGAEILARLDSDFFVPRHARTTEAEREVLRWIAEEGDAAAVEALLARHEIRNGQLQARVVGLIAKGLLYRPERGRLAFSTPLFGDFLRRRAFAPGLPGS